MNEVWHAALSILAEEDRPLFWRLTYGAAFWWMPPRSELTPGGFATQPFTYGEVASVTVFDAVRLESVFTCDLTVMSQRLGGVAGLLVTELRDVTCPPVRPPNRALQLAAR